REVGGGGGREFGVEMTSHFDRGRAGAQEHVQIRTVPVLLDAQPGDAELVATHVSGVARLHHEPALRERDALVVGSVPSVQVEGQGEREYFGACKRQHAPRPEKGEDRGDTQRDAADEGEYDQQVLRRNRAVALDGEVEYRFRCRRVHASLPAWNAAENLVKNRAKLAHCPRVGQDTLRELIDFQFGIRVAHFTIRLPSLATRGSPFHACPYTTSTVAGRRPLRRSPS